jgi:hypothetical protein
VFDRRDGAAECLVMTFEEVALALIAEFAGDDEP